MEKVVIVGAGAQCKVVLDVLQSSTEYEVIGLVDTNPEKRIFGIPVIGDDQILPELYGKGIRHGFVAIGNNKIREKIQRSMEQMGYEMITLVSRYAVVSRHADIAAGTILMPGAVVNACARIGKGCILNTNCSVDHDCDIGDFCHIAPGCAISGTTTVSGGTFLGTGTNVIDGITIGQHCVIGSGAAVVKNIPENCLAVGVPAKIKKEMIH